MGEVNFESKLRLLPRTWRKALPLDWEILLGGVLFLELLLFVILFTNTPSEHFSFRQCRDCDFLFGDGKSEAFFFTFAAVWGTLRVLLTHPVFHDDYRQWLSISPWKAGDPLPKGDVFLSLRDGLLVALVGVWAIWRGGLDGGLNLVIGFLVGYLGALSLQFFVLKMELVAQFLSWSGLLLLFLAPGGWLTLVAFVILLQIASRWINESIIQSMVKDFVPSPVSSRGYQRFGWPYQDLAPVCLERQQIFSPTYANRLRIILFAVASGLIAFSFIRAMPDKQAFDGAGEGTLLVVSAAFIAGLIRIAIWLNGIRAPISLRGRLAMGRLVFWRYDRVFVTPLMGLAVALGLMAVSNIFEFAWIWTIPIALTSVILINGLGLPTRLEYRRTHCGRFGLMVKDRELTRPS